MIDQKTLQRIEDSTMADIRVLGIITPMVISAQFSNSVCARVVRKIPRESSMEHNDSGGQSYESNDATEMAVMFAAWGFPRYKYYSYAVNTTPVTAPRVVVNLLYGREAEFGEVGMIGVTRVQVLVVIFTPTGNQNYDHDPEDDDCWDNIAPYYEPLGYLKDFFRNSIAHIKNMNITLVDKLNVPPHLLAAPDGVSTAELEPCIRGMFVNLMGAAHHFAAGEAAADRLVREQVRFVTLAEYTEEVGEEQFGPRLSPAKYTPRRSLGSGRTLEVRLRTLRVASDFATI